MQVPKWTEADLPLLKQILRGAEARLATQAQLAASNADRATVIGSLGVLLIFLGICGGSVLHGLHILPNPFARFLLAQLLFYAVAAIHAFRAARPIKWWAPGNDPQEWYGDIRSQRPHWESLGEQAVHYNDMIFKNREIMSSNSDRLCAATWILMFAPVVSYVLSVL